jgi:hypothetical protein
VVERNAACRGRLSAPYWARAGYGPTCSLQLRVGSGTPRVLTLSIAGNNPAQIPAGLGGAFSLKYFYELVLVNPEAQKEVKC